MMAKRFEKPDFVCPNCGEDVPAGAKCCPHCGSDDETGWAENAEVSSIDPTFDEEDYQQTLEREFGSSKRSRPGKWLLSGVSALLIFLWLYYLAR